MTASAVVLSVLLATLSPVASAGELRLQLFDDKESVYLLLVNEDAGHSESGIPLSIDPGWGNVELTFEARGRKYRPTTTGNPRPHSLTPLGSLESGMLVGSVYGKQLLKDAYKLPSGCYWARARYSPKLVADKAAKTVRASQPRAVCFRR